MAGSRGWAALAEEAGAAAVLAVAGSLRRAISSQTNAWSHNASAARGRGRSGFVE